MASGPTHQKIARELQHIYLPDGMKLCWSCREVKPVEVFRPNKRATDGRSNKCEDCFVTHSKGSGKKGRKDGEKTKYGGVIRAQALHAPWGSPEYRRWEDLMKRYGITPDEYELYFEAQGGCCAVCGTHQDELVRTLAVDHDRVTGEVRGLLCTRCNMGLGLFLHSPDRLKDASAYLERFYGTLHTSDTLR